MGYFNVGEFNRGYAVSVRMRFVGRGVAFSESAVIDGSVEKPVTFLLLLFLHFMDEYYNYQSEGVSVAILLESELGDKRVTVGELVMSAGKLDFSAFRSVWKQVELMHEMRGALS